MGKIQKKITPRLRRGRAGNVRGGRLYDPDSPTMGGNRKRKKKAAR